MSLPKEKSTPVDDLREYVTLIYGKPGVGKTTLAAQFENPLFLMCEPGAKSLSIYKKDISSWKKLVNTIDDLETEKHNYKTSVLDTFPAAFEMCQKAVCRANGWEHPQDGPYGKGWSAVYNEFSFQMTRLLSHMGVVFIAHAGEKDIEQLDGTVKTQIAPDMTGQAMKFISRIVDVIAYYYYAKNGNRYIRIGATDDIMAKNRIQGHFVGITKFNAGDSPEVAYENFVAAFENKKVEKENQDGKQSGSSTNSKNGKGLLLKRIRS